MTWASPSCCYHYYYYFFSKSNDKVTKYFTNFWCRVHLGREFCASQTHVCVSTFSFFFLAENFDFSTNFQPHVGLVHFSRTHKFYFSVTFSLKMDSTILFTHLKIILLHCFSVFSFQLYPNRPIVNFLLVFIYAYH